MLVFTRYVISHIKLGCPLPYDVDAMGGEFVILFKSIGLTR